MTKRKTDPHLIRWNGKIGPSSLISFGGALSVLITIGWMWANQAAETKAAALAASEAKIAIANAEKNAQRRDAVINDHSISLGKIVTELGYVGPALQRIESKIGAVDVGVDRKKTKQ